MNTLQTESPFVFFKQVENRRLSLSSSWLIRAQAPAGGGRVLMISSDRDDQRNFGGLENFGKYYFGLLGLSRDFFCVFKTI